MILNKINFRNFLKVIVYLISIPVLLLIRLIGPLYLIRWSCTQSTRIGHYVENIQIYLAMKQQKKNFLSNRKYLDIFYDRTSVCNSQIQKMWRRSEHTLFLPNWIMDPLNNVNEYFLDKIIPSKRLHEIGYYYEPGKLFENLEKGEVVPLTCVDTFNCLDKSEKLLEFTESEKKKGINLLREMGINTNESYVILVLRGENFLKEKYPNVDWSRHSHRNTDLKFFTKTVEYLKKENYKIVLIGSGAKAYANTNIENVINYEASKYKSDFLDIFIFSLDNCKFIISSITGIDSVAQLFHKHVLEIGVIPFSYARTYSKYYSFIFKKYYSKTLDRFLTMEEIFNLNIHRIFGNQLNNEIEFIHPSPDEILGSTKELVHRLNNSSISIIEPQKLQKDFGVKYSQYINTFYPERSTDKICGYVTEDYISKNQYLMK